MMWIGKPIHAKFDIVRNPPHKGRSYLLLFLVIHFLESYCLCMNIILVARSGSFAEVCGAKHRAKRTLSQRVLLSRGPKPIKGLTYREQLRQNDARLCGFAWICSWTGLPVTPQVPVEGADPFVEGVIRRVRNTLSVCMNVHMKTCTFFRIERPRRVSTERPRH